MRRLMSAVVIGLFATAMPAQAQESKTPRDLAGKYRCDPEPRECLLGKTFAVTQSGNRLEMENEKGERVRAQVTGDITLTMGPPWNTLGVVYGRAIQWSNGTKWTRAD